MPSSRNPSGDDAVVSRAIEIAIRIAAIAFVLFAVGEILAPFLSPIVWGIIIAVAAFPLFRWWTAQLGGRRGLAAISFTLLALLFLITPTVWLTSALVEWGRGFAAQIAEGGLKVPPPPPGVAAWPLVGQRLDQLWSLASSNLEAALGLLEPQLKAVAPWLLTSLAAAGVSVLKFVFSIVIAGVLLASSEEGGRLTRRLFVRLAPTMGADYARLAEQTVRSVANGVIGVAVIQALLAGAGFLAVGVPAAAFLALVCLVLAVVQLPMGVVVLPIVAYVWFTDTTLTAILFTAWNVPVILVDNLLKPLLLGRGVEAPMPVIFLGAIGGLVTSGIIGLFVGAVILVLAYELFRSWLDASQGATLAGESSSETLAE